MEYEYSGFRKSHYLVIKLEYRCWRIENMVINMVSNGT